MSFAVNTSIRVNSLQNMMTISQSLPSSPLPPYQSSLAQDVFLSGASGGFGIQFSPSNNTQQQRRQQQEERSGDILTVPKRNQAPPPRSIQFSPLTPNSTNRSTKSSSRNQNKRKKRKQSLANRLVKALSAPPLPIEDGNSTLGLGAPRQSMYIPPPPSPNNMPKKKNNKPKKARRANSSVATGDSCTTATTVRSMETSSSRLPRSSVMMRSDKFSFMSYRFPVTQTTEKLVLRKRKLPTSKNSTSRDIDIETIDGRILGTVEDGAITGDPDIRRIKDITGRPCAIIKRHFDPAILYGPKICFRVYGDKPCTLGQERSTEEVVSGTYLWAEIKNTGSIDGSKFEMKRYSTETDSCSAQQHITKRFGSLFSTKSKGYTMLDHEEKECVKIVSLQKNRNKGIVIGPNRDMCLMLAFCTVVDEYVEHRLI